MVLMNIQTLPGSRPCHHPSQTKLLQSADQMMEATFQIIDASVDTNALFQEMQHVSDKLDGSLAQVGMKELLSVTCRQIQLNSLEGSRNSLLSTPALAQQVVNFVEKHDIVGDELICSEKIMAEWSVCLNEIKESINTGIFISSLFTSWIAECKLNIELRWDLYTVRALDIDSHLVLHLQDVTERKALGQTLINLCFCDNRQSERILRRTSILTGLTQVLVEKGYSSDRNNGPKDCKIYQQTLDILLEGLLAASQNDTDRHFISPFVDLLNAVCPTARKKFTRHALAFFLQRQPNMKFSEQSPAITPEKAGSHSKVITLVMQQLLECLTPTEATDVVLHQSLKCDDINSVGLNAFLTALVNTGPQANQAIANFVKTLLASGLQESDVIKTTSAFYIARQQASVNPAFPCYRDWFQQMFGDRQTSLANSRSSFIFLTKCLSDWISLDDPEYLKSHILRKPFVPSRLREVYQTYAIMAKSRLHHLNVPVNDSRQTNNAVVSKLGYKRKPQGVIEIE